MKLSSILTEIQSTINNQIGNPMELLRGYRLNEIQEEMGEIEETSDSIYPKDVKTNIVNQMKELYRKPIDKIIEFVDVSSSIDNTEAFDKELDVAKARSLMGEYEDDYMNAFKNLMNTASFPPPIVVEYNGRRRLIGGNRRAVRLNIEANRLGIGSIPVILIKVEE